MEPTIYSRFKKLALAAPERPAIIDERSCVNREGLDLMIDSLISRFPSFIPARVGVVMDHGVEMTASLLAINKAGASFVAVEPDYPPERLTRFLTESGVDFVITQEKYASIVKDFTRLIVGDHLFVNPPLHSLPDRSVASRAAYILYKSTPTGYPAGVMSGNSQVVAMAERFGKLFKVSEDDVMLQYSACTVNNFIEEVFGILLNGAVLAIPSADTRNHPEQLMKFADDHYVSIISGFPYLMQALNSMRTLPMTLRLVISSGDTLNAASVDHLTEQLPVYNTYGPPVATALSTAYCCNEGEALESGRYPIGKELEGVQVMLLDENLNPVPQGETGEICIAGSGVADSFTGDHRSELLSGIVTLSDGTRVARTGDMGLRLPDGNLVYERRKESEVNILGRRVVTGEVERALMASGEVNECAVMHYNDEQGSAYLVAYVVPSSPSFSLSWLKNRLAQYLPSYMIPEFFVLLRKLPVTETGTVNSQALPIVVKDVSTTAHAS